MNDTRTFCRICIAHCGLIVTTEGDRVLKVRGDVDHPASQGYTCAKGRSLPAWHHGASRIDRPRMRRPDGDGSVPCAWDEALDDLAGRIRREISLAGPDSVALFVGNGGSLDPAGRRAGLKLVGGIGSSSIYSVATIDAPSKPVVADLVAGNPALFSGSPDFGRCSLTILIGTNPVISHGHTASWTNPNGKIRQLTSQGELWVVDPRRTETAKRATRHLQTRAGTDYAWLACVIRELLGQGVSPPEDVAYRGLSELRAAVEPWTVEVAARHCRVDGAQITDLIDAIRVHGRLAVQTGTGVSMTQEAPVVEWLIWALLILTDSVDQPGGVRFNAGALHRADRRPWPATRGEVSAGPRSRPELPHRLGEHASAALCDEIEAANVRVLIAFGANLMTAMPDAGRLATALATLEALVSIETVDNATTSMATHVLPSVGQLERADLPYLTDMYAATSWTQYTPPVVDAAGDRKPGWWIFAELARRLGLDPGEWAASPTPEAAADDDAFLRPLLASAPVTLDDLESGAPRLFDTEWGWVRRGVAGAGGWELAPRQLLGRLEQALSCEPDGLLLTPRRQLRQQNSQLTKTGTSDGRRERAVLLMNPVDARARGLRGGMAAQVTGPSGALEVVIDVDPDIGKGCVSLPHGHDLNANALTSATTLIDPLTGMVLMSGLPVIVEPVC